MKTKFFTQAGAVLGLLGLLTTGCEKVAQRDLTPLPYAANQQSPYPKFTGQACKGKGGNCLPEVVVIGHLEKREALNSAFASMTGKPEEVKAFFTGATWKEFFPMLADEDHRYFLERLQSGECDIKRVELDNQVFYYAGANELTVDTNEVVLPVIYTE